MKQFSFLIGVVMTAMFFTSCKSGSTGMPVPKNAAVVVHINGASLSKKLDWKDIKATEWFKEMYKKSVDRKDSFQQKIMDDPENSGVDIKNDFVFFVQPHGKTNYMVFEGNIKDKSKFEAMLKEMNEGKATSKDGDLSYMNDGSQSITSWTGSKFFFVNNTGSRDYSYSSDEKPSVATDSLLKYTKGLLDLKKSDGIESDDHFSSLVKEDGDIHFWANMEQYYNLIGSAMQNSPVTAMMGKINEFNKGSISTGVMNFDDGKIVVKTKQYLGEQAKKLYDKYKFEPITKELVNKVPSDNVVAAMFANYPPEALKDISKALGIDGFINIFLGKIGYSLDELVQATKGQIVLSVTDFTWPARPTTSPQDYSQPMPQPDAAVLFAMSVKDKAAFDKLVSSLEGQIENEEQRQMIMSKLKYQVTNDWFAASNHPEAVQQFLAGGNRNLAFADKITGHPFGMYIDVQKILKTLPPSMMDGEDMSQAAASTWQDIVFSGGDYKDGVSTAEVSINFVDKNTNSLKQINQFIEKMHLAHKKREAEWEKNDNNSGTDSLVVPPAITPEN